MNEKKFKTCPLCGRSWESQASFIKDDNVCVIGYQVNKKKIEEGLLLFNHDCGTTFAMYALEFKNLYNGPIFIHKKMGFEGCPGHCLHKSNLESCPMDCEFVWVRDVIQVLKKNNEE